MINLEKELPSSSQFIEELLLSLVSSRSCKEIFVLLSNSFKHLFEIDGFAIEVHEPGASPIILHAEGLPVLGKTQILNLSASFVKYFSETNQRIVEVDTDNPNIKVASLQEKINGISIMGINTHIAVPMNIRGQLTGLLHLFTRRRLPMIPQEVIYPIVQYAAVAIRNGWVSHQHIQQSQRNKALYQVTKALTSTLDLQTVLMQVLEKLCQLIKVDRGSIYLLDESGKFLKGQMSINADDTEIRRHKTYLDKDDFTKEVLETRKPVVIKDAHNDPRPVRIIMEKYNVKSIMGIPLIIKGQVIGIIFADNSQKQHAFSTEEQELALAFANQAAFAIQNARHVQRLSELNEVVNQKNNSLKRSLSIHEKLTHVVLSGKSFDAIAKTLYKLVKNPVVIEDQFMNKIASAYPSNSQDGEEDLSHKIDTLKDLMNIPTLKKELNVIQKDKKPVFLNLSEFDRPSIVVAPVVAAGQIYGYVYVIECSHSLDPLDHVAVEHCATVIALEMLKQKSAFQLEMKLKADFLDELLNPGSKSINTLPHKAAYLGYDLSRPHVVMVASVQSVEASKLPQEDSSDNKLFQYGKTFDLIKHVVDNHIPGSLVVEKQSKIIIFLASLNREGTCLNILKTANAIKADIERKMHGKIFSIGIGRECLGIGDFAESYREANIALDMICDFNTEEKVQFFNKLGILKLLSHVEPKKYLNSFACEILGELVNYDIEHNTSFLETLSRYIQFNGNLKKTSENCYVHINTLRYRLERIQELTNLDLNSAEVRLNIQLALRIFKILFPNKESLSKN